MSKRKPDLAALIVEAHSLAERLTAVANAASVTDLAAQPEGVREALRAATAALYFGVKHEQALRAVIRALSPDLAHIIAEQGEAAAFRVTHPETNS